MTLNYKMVNGLITDEPQLNSLFFIKPNTNHMEEWKPGDVAICINTSSNLGHVTVGNPPPLRKNSEYLVNNIYACECGVVSLDVGISTNKGTTCSCGGKTSPTSGIWWCNAKRFVKKKVEHKEDALIASILQTSEN